MSSARGRSGVWTRQVDFLGIGWAFPVALDKEGHLATVRDEEDVRQAIRLILQTDPGERVMVPEFGAGLGELVFEPINTTTIALARHRVQQALVTWEPRIDNVTVEVDADAKRGVLEIEIGYRLRSTNTFFNLVYPFYLQEGAP